MDTEHCGLHFVVEIAELKVSCFFPRPNILDSLLSFLFDFLNYSWPNYSRMYVNRKVFILQESLW